MNLMLERDKDSKIQCFFSNLSLVLLSVICSFLVLEFGARLFLKETALQYEDFIRHPRPYTMFGPAPDEYLDGLPPRDKDASEFRIFMLGGSTIYSGDPPLPKLVEMKLHEAGLISVKVFNYGVPSQNSGQELARLVYEILEHKPDMVISYDGGNDIMDPYFWDPRPNYPYNFLAYENNPLLDPSFDRYPTFALVGLGSKLLRILLREYYTEHFFNLQRHRQESGYLSSDWRDKLASSYVRNLEKKQKISKAYGLKYIAFFQPLLYFKKPRSEEEAKLSGLTGSDSAPEAEQHSSLMRELILAKLEDAKKANKLNFIDLSGSLDGNTLTIFQDYIHVSQSGNATIADKIVIEVQREIMNSKHTPQVN